MKCLRIYATPDGESHIEETEIPIELTRIFLDRPPVYVSSQYPAWSVQIVAIPAGIKDSNWHTAPGRILTVWLDGEAEFETSDGDVRRLPPGGILFAEDTYGKGHISRLPEKGQQIIMIFLRDLAV
jgi:hypothetical protein